MLKPSNLFTSRRGKAAETFNFCRGMQTKKEEGLFCLSLSTMFLYLNDIRGCCEKRSRGD
jgi:hypothetical protein